MSTIKIGILHEMSEGPPCPTDVEHWLRLVLDEQRATRGFDHEVEIVHGWGLGLPNGTAAAVERAYVSLVEQQALLIVGPAIGDNALVATPLAAQHQVPTLNWAGSEWARGDYMFHLQVGSHEDESIILARHLAATGIERVAVAYDQSPIGLGHLHHFEQEALRLEVAITAKENLNPCAEEARDSVAALLAGSPDAMVYFGLGLSAPAVAVGLRERGWGGPSLMNTAGLRGYYGDFARIIDGWIYVDMHSDGNQTLRELRQRLDLPQQRALAAAKGYDLARLAVEGIARAPELTRDGVRAGLEHVKWLPAAEGEEGTLLGFGYYDRGALHGRYLVLRQWLDGRSIQLRT